MNFQAYRIVVNAKFFFSPYFHPMQLSLHLEKKKKNYSFSPWKPVSLEYSIGIFDHSNTLTSEFRYSGFGYVTQGHTMCTTLPASPRLRNSKKQSVKRAHMIAQSRFRAARDLSVFHAGSSLRRTVHSVSVGTERASLHLWSDAAIS